MFLGGSGCWWHRSVHALALPTSQVQAKPPNLPWNLPRNLPSSGHCNSSKANLPKLCACKTLRAADIVDPFNLSAGITTPSKKTSACCSLDCRYLRTILTLSHMFWSCNLDISLFFTFIKSIHDISSPIHLTRLVACGADAARICAGGCT